MFSFQMVFYFMIAVLSQLSLKSNLLVYFLGMYLLTPLNVLDVTEGQFLSKIGLNSEFFLLLD